MALKPSIKKRARAERFPASFIDRKIVLIITNQFPERVKEHNLCDALREKWGISEKEVKTHLAGLEKKNVLIKEENKGLPNAWDLSEDIEIFKSLVRGFHNSEDELEFVGSGYTRSMIDDFFDTTRFLSFSKKEFSYIIRYLFIQRYRVPVPK